MLAAKYAHSRRVTTRQRFVTPATINEVLAAAPHDCDVLSIDVDGQDYWLWQALDVVRPKIVVIEYNSELADGQPLVEPLHDPACSTGNSGVEGASLAALRDLGAEKGYKLVYAELAGVNLFFVRDEFASRFPDDIDRRGTNQYLMSRDNYHHVRQG